MSGGSKETQVGPITMSRRELRDAVKHMKRGADYVVEVAPDHPSHKEIADMAWDVLIKDGMEVGLATEVVKGPWQIRIPWDVLQWARAKLAKQVQNVE